MIASYRYTGDNIYIQPMLNRDEDKANILLARADWRADGVVPTKQFDKVFPTWVEEMELTWRNTGMNDLTKAEAERVGIPTGNNTILPRSFFPKPFYLTEMIYEKSSNDFIGFTRTWLDGTKAEHILTCFHPDKRGKGYHNDYAVMSSKAWFLFCEGESSVHFTPRGQSSYYVSDPYASVAKTCVDRIDPVDYIENKFTKDEYTTYMNQSDKQADKDATFLMERYIDV